MMHQLIVLNFQMGNRPYAVRMWPAVPRVGDVVNLRNPDRDVDNEGLRYPARVVLVCWAVREESWAGEQLECDVHIIWDDHVVIPKS